MTSFKGFKTKREAQEFIKKMGYGLLCYRKSDTEQRGRHEKDYNCAVAFGGLNSEKYPYCVQWNTVIV